MRPEILKYCYDIHQACQAIFSFLKGKTFSDYDNDDMLKSAVERQLMIIGEAMSQAVKIDSSISSHISNIRGIINLRNVIVHGYMAVENQTIWGIVESDLPALFKEVQTILGK